MKTIYIYMSEQKNKSYFRDNNNNKVFIRDCNELYQEEAIWQLKMAQKSNKMNTYSKIK